MLNLDLSDTVVQMSGSTCSRTRRKLPEIQDIQNQELFYIQSRVDQLQKESTMNESEKVDDHAEDKITEAENVEAGITRSNPVENGIDIEIEKESQTDIDDVDNTSLNLVLPKDPTQNYLYRYYVPHIQHILFHPFPHPVLMPYSRHQPYPYFPLCFPYCKI